MEVVSVKLVTGEEIIGRLKLTTEHDLVLNTVRLMMLVQGKEPGTVGLQLMPWAYSCVQDGDLPPINRNTVIFLNKDVPMDLEKRYVAETSSIQLV